MGLTKFTAMWCVVGSLAAARAEPAETERAAANVHSILEPVQRIGDTRLLVPTATTGSHPDRLLSMALSPDEALLATGEQSGLIRLWSLPDGKEVKRLSERAPHGSVHYLGFLGSGAAQQARKSALATLDADLERQRQAILAEIPKADAEAKRRAVLELEEIYRRKRHSIAGLGNLPKGMLVSSHWSGKILLWDPETGESREVGGPAYTVRPVQTAADGRTVMGHEGRIYLWPSDVFIETEPTRIAQLHFVPGSSRVIALGSFGQPPVLVDLKRKKVLHKFGSRSVTNVAVSPNGRTLATFGRTEQAGWNEEDGFVRLWDVTTGREWAQLAKNPPAHYGVWFAPGGYSLLVRHRDGLRLWEVASRHERAFIKADGYAILFSRDGRLLYSLSMYDKHVTVWDLSGRQNIAAPDPAALTPKALEQFWQDLAGNDAKRAYAAIWRLASAPEQAVPFFADKIREMPGVDRKRVPALVAELNSPQFAKRDRATRELPKFGRWAQAELLAELAKDPPLEMKRRLEQLLGKLHDEFVSPDQILALRIVEVLEKIESRASRQLLEALRDGDKPHFSEPARETLIRAIGS